MAAAAPAVTHTARIVALAELKPHPRNYRVHPSDQIEHLAASIREHGLYRNVVVARDLTILAGHGVTQACAHIGITHIPVVVLDLAPSSPRALKLLAGDNEVSHLVESDDRALSELLKEIKETDLTGLLGTGYDAAMLATLAMVTRPASEIADFDAAAEWAGMPELGESSERSEGGRIVVNFRTSEDRTEFARLLGVRLTPQSDTMWFPPKERNDLASVRFEASA